MKMNKRLFRTALLAVVMLLSFNGESKAQFFKNLFDKAEDVVTSVTGGITISPSTLAGSWDYVKPAIKLYGGDALSNASGALLVSQVEPKITEMCAKVGIAPGMFFFTFTQDGNFVCSVKGIELKGKYTTNSEAATVTLNFSVANTIKVGTLTSQAVIDTRSLSLLFEADAILDLVNKLSEGLNNESVKAVASLLKNYEGLRLGFELSRK